MTEIILRYNFSFSNALAKSHDQWVGELKRFVLLMVNHYSAKFSDHGRFSSGNVMFLVIERHESTCFHFNPPLLFICKASNMNAHDISY